MTDVLTKTVNILRIDLKLKNKNNGHTGDNDYAISENTILEKKQE
jgi:hypothetical protein